MRIDTSWDGCYDKCGYNGIKHQWERFGDGVCAVSSTGVPDDRRANFCRQYGFSAGSASTTVSSPTPEKFVEYCAEDAESNNADGFSVNTASGRCCVHVKEDPAKTTSYEDVVCDLEDDTWCLPQSTHGDFEDNTDSGSWIFRKWGGFKPITTTFTKAGYGCYKKVE